MGKPFIFAAMIIIGLGLCFDFLNAQLGVGHLIALIVFILLAIGVGIPDDKKHGSD